MSDDADRSDQRIMDTVNDGIARARRALNTARLTPIIQELDGTRFGVCHWCTSPIRPGTLFCETYKEDPGHSCSTEWEHERQRKKVSGL